MAGAGAEVGLLHTPSGREPVPIVLRAEPGERPGLAKLEGVALHAPDGRMVPLAELVTVVETTEDRNIYHKNLRRATYVIADVEVTDPACYAEYRDKVPATVAAYGGRFLVRGGPHQVAEGSWHPHRVVVLEFPSMEQARRWYESEDYRGPKALRQAAARTDVIFVEGV